MKIMRPHAAGKNLVQAGDKKQVISLQWPNSKKVKVILNELFWIVVKLSMESLTYTYF